MATTPSHMILNHDSTMNGSNNHVLLRVKRRRTDPPPASCLVLVESVQNGTVSCRGMQDGGAAPPNAKRKTLEYGAGIATQLINEQLPSSDTSYRRESNPWTTISSCAVATAAAKQETIVNQISNNVVTTTFWKRRYGENDLVDQGNCPPDVTLPGSNSQHHGPCHIVEAVLEVEDTVPIAEISTFDDLSPRHHTGSKRRRLTLIGTVCTPSVNQIPSPLAPKGPMRKSNKSHYQRRLPNQRHRNNQDKYNGKSPRSIPFYPVLDPISRLVDESLKAVHVGEVSAWKHWEFLTTDSRLQRNDGNPDTKWYVWNQSSGGGNILHACSLWNEIELLTHIMQASVEDSEVIEDIRGPSLQNSWLQIMLKAVNGDGWTPLQVATLTGHDSIVQILQTMSGGSDTNSTPVNTEEDFVYDEYWLCPGVTSDFQQSDGREIEEQNQHSSKLESETDFDDLALDTTNVMTAELQGGFWEDGVLVFAPEGQRDDDDIGTGAAADDDEDSNSEGYAGNDYPEENDDTWQVFDNDGIDNDDDGIDHDDHFDHDTEPKEPLRKLQIGEHHLPSFWSAASDVQEYDVVDEYDDEWCQEKSDLSQSRFAYDSEWDQAVCDDELDG